MIFDGVQVKLAISQLNLLNYYCKTFYALYIMSSSLTSYLYVFPRYLKNNKRDCQLTLLITFCRRKIVRMGNRIYQLYPITNIYAKFQLAKIYFRLSYLRYNYPS